MRNRRAEFKIQSGSLHLLTCKYTWEGYESLASRYHFFISVKYCANLCKKQITELIQFHTHFQKTSTSNWSINTQMGIAIPPHASFFPAHDQVKILRLFFWSLSRDNIDYKYQTQVCFFSSLLLCDFTHSQKCSC